MYMYMYLVSYHILTQFFNCLSCVHITAIPEIFMLKIICIPNFCVKFFVLCDDLTCIQLLITCAKNFEIIGKHEMVQHKFGCLTRATPQTYNYITCSL